MALDQLIKVEHEDEEPYIFVANRPVVIIRYRLILGEDGEWRRRGRIQKIGPECTIPPKSKNFVMANHL